ncbi:MAG: segregation/condensation protein A [Cyanobium sp. MAG06]|nr:segregation/condensation protein A [Cyanobium sp. MAG06]
MVEIETKTNNINNNNNTVSIDADVVSSVSNIKDVIANVPDNIQTIFIVKQGRFEGPYHKLLEMIENRKLSISEISLSQIADNYIEYVRDIRDKNNDITPEELSQFILIASTLMLIKARSLLPDIILESEEEKEISQLEHKLELLRLLKLAENNIKSI